ncbi:uncharacterized protein LODBEIA_P41870 [Lodderomyces beijingensis]|uniref:Ribonuclease P protein subunit n=1 Tax=Lodderomyces beijingensis TaxID=1775926 RepID=A0ABP0ZQK4_9ASCO
MTSTNKLEKQILTRCYDSQAEILAILESRYSTTGTQKPHIFFKKTSTTNTTPSTLKQTTTTIKRQDVSSQRRKTTRTEVKSYITATLKSQRKLIKKIQANRNLAVEEYLHRYNIPKFEHFLEMNHLWHQYMQSLLSLSSSGASSSLSIPSQSILPKLASADFNGCLVSVIQSRNTNLVGIRGIVVWDAQHSFILVCPRGEESREWNAGVARGDISAGDIVGGLKIVPKKHTLFAFDVVLPCDDGAGDGDGVGDGEVESLGFTILGSRFELRSVDRAARKFKNHAVDDIL